MRTFKLLAAVFISVALFAEFVQSANVLLALSLSSRSHRNVMDPILEGLMKKGHTVTVVSSFPASSNPKGVTTVEVKSIDKFMAKRGHTNFFVSSKASPIQVLSILNELIFGVANATFNDPDFKEFILSGQHFDLVLLDGIVNDHMLVMPYHFNAPGVLLSPGPLFPQTNWNMDIPFPAAVHTVSGFPFPTPMNFKHRMLNALGVVASVFNRNYFFLPPVQKLVEEHFPGAPPILDLEKNISLILSNTFPSLTGSKPSMPYVVEMGGIHCRQPKKLDKELEKVVNSTGDDGFIIFSLGSVTAGTFIPEDVRLKMLKIFAAQKQTVFWKYEGEMPDAPKNVKLVKWLPQQDLLGHPKCKLFITHGGLLSLEEAVYHGVPVLAVPLSVDQYGNAQRTRGLGIGDRFYWDEFTEEEVLAKIDKLLNDPKYKNRVKQLSELFRDRPMDIVDNAVYWMEYVMRTGGAHHLKTDAKEFSVAQYFLLDVIAFIGLGVAVTLAVLVFVICKTIRFLKKTLIGSDQHPGGKVLQAKKNK